MLLRLKMAILQSGRKQWQIAREMGIHETRLSKYVQGYGHLNDGEKRRLEEILGVRDESDDDTQAAGSGEKSGRLRSQLTPRQLDAAMPATEGEDA